MKLLYGSQNFGYDNKDSDKDWIEFVYPSIEDISRRRVASKELKNDDDSFTKVKDIRLIIDMIKKANVNDLQFLYSQETIGCDDLKWFFDNRDRLAKARPRQMYKSNLGYIRARLKEDTRKSRLAALATALIVLDMILEIPIQFRNERLSELRDSNENINVEEIVNLLIALEGEVDLMEDDNDILSQAEEEMQRLLIKHLKEII